MRPDRLKLDMESLDPTLIANRNRASGRFGSKRIFSMFFPHSKLLGEAKPVVDEANNNDSLTYSEEAFQHGISFEAKLVGWLDIPRPQSRMEIVAAMRRVRYEHKTKGIGKRKVDLKISVDGVRVCAHDGGKNRLGFGRVEYDKLDNLISLDVEPITILNHPVHRIFYVSHDSQDMNVFSYIVRENQNENLRCIVFKARRKAEAMQIVKTIGQAFDVCHVLQQRKENRPKLSGSSHSTEASPRKINYGSTLPAAPLVMPTSDSQESIHASSSSSVVDEISRHPTTCPNIQRIKKSLSELNPTGRNGLPHALTGSLTTSHLTGTITSKPMPASASNRMPGSLSGASLLTGLRQSSPHSCLSVLTARLDHELQKGRAAASQIAFLKGQVASETAARIDAQSRIDELLRQNAMLLDVIEGLLTPDDSLDSTNKTGLRDSISLLRSGSGRRNMNQTLLVQSGGPAGSTSTGSSTDGQLGHASSPDSGVKSAFSYHLNDDEMY